MSESPARFLHDKPAAQEPSQGLKRLSAKAPLVVMNKEVMSEPAHCSHQASASAYGQASVHTALSRALVWYVYIRTAWRPERVCV